LLLSALSNPIVLPRSDTLPKAKFAASLWRVLLYIWGSCSCKAAVAAADTAVAVIRLLSLLLLPLNVKYARVGPIAVILLSYPSTIIAADAATASCVVSASGCSCCTHRNQHVMHMLYMLLLLLQQCCS
jgi:hypothetical protein